MTPRGVRDALVAEAPFTCVITLLALSFLYLAVEPTHWLRGTGGVSVALLVGSVLRIVVPSERAGLLAIRAKWIDVCCYASLGVLIISTGLLLPS